MGLWCRYIGFGSGLMGKSDSIIFPEYIHALSKMLTEQPKSIAFLGFNSENALTRSITSSKRAFFDLSLGNWDINKDWFLDEKYDLIVCTRCAYFSKDPSLFVEKCMNHLNKGGYALIDWGLGDHWRFDDFKIGWVKNGEHEFAYSDQNFLHSCFWNESLNRDPSAVEFWNQCLKKGYSQDQTLESVVREEVPSIVDYDCCYLSTKFLWPESPQLYIITLIKGED